MMIQRRQFLQLASTVATLPLVLPQARAESFPTRPMHIIVGFPPGGDGSIIARLIGQGMQERLGQQVIIENHPGAGSNLGTEMVVRSPADGYTLTWASA